MAKDILTSEINVDSKNQESDLCFENEFEIEDIWCSGCALNTSGYEPIGAE
ncbi:MAG: hypothetical protein ACFFDF_20265 [Candidatus Odinarchaeota archaeon]